MTEEMHGAESLKDIIMTGMVDMVKQRILFFILIASCIFSLSGCDIDPTKGDEKEYVFCIYEIYIAVGDDLDKIIDDIPSYNSFNSAPSCADVGTDELYIYNGFRISAHRSNGRCEITMIELTNDTVSTFEGMSIGDTEEKLRLCYGEGERSANTVEYKSKNCILRFYMREGKIVSIKYIKNSN